MCLFYIRPFAKSIRNAGGGRWVTRITQIAQKVTRRNTRRTSRNTNDTLDVGPMQVNTIWVSRLAARWRTTREAAHAALRRGIHLSPPM